MSRAQVICATGWSGAVVGACAAMGAFISAASGDVHQAWALFWVMTTAWGVAGAAFGVFIA